MIKEHKLFPEIEVYESWNQPFVAYNTPPEPPCHAIPTQWYTRYDFVDVLSIIQHGRKAIREHSYPEECEKMFELLTQGRWGFIREQGEELTCIYEKSKERAQAILDTVLLLARKGLVINLNQQRRKRGR